MQMKQSWTFIFSRISWNQNAEIESPYYTLYLESYRGIIFDERYGVKIACPDCSAVSSEKYEFYIISEQIATYLKNNNLNPKVFVWHNEE